MPAVCYQGDRSDEGRSRFGLARAHELGLVRRGDVVVATAGQHRRTGSTDIIRVVTVE